MIIDKLHSNYLLKRCREKPDFIQKRLDKIASTILLKELEKKLSRLSNNDYFLFIKDINIDFKINLSKMDDRAVASLWADRISSNIFDKIRTINRNEVIIHEESGLAVFPDKATYYAYFIRDLIDGVIQHKWYYKSLEGLEFMNKPVALMLIFKQAQELSGNILVSLEKIGSLEKFIQTLTEKDAKEIYLEYLKESTKPEIKLDSREYEMTFDKLSEFIYSLGEMKSKEILVTSKSYKKCLKLYTLFKKEHPVFGLYIYTRRIIEDIILRGKPLEVKEELKPQEEIVSQTTEEKAFKALKEFTSLYGGLFLLIPAISKICLEEIILKTAFPEKYNLIALNFFLFFLGITIAKKEISSSETIDPGFFLFAGLDKQVPVNTLKNYSDYVTPKINRDFVNQLLKKLELRKAQSLPYLDYVVLDDLKKNVDTKNFNSVIKMTTSLVLKVFARDLRGFEESSHTYLFKNFIERESKIKVKNNFIYINLAKKPLDTVLRLSGLLDYDIRIPWLKNRTIEFTLR